MRHTITLSHTVAFFLPLRISRSSLERSCTCGEWLLQRIQVERAEVEVVDLENVVAFLESTHERASRAQHPHWVGQEAHDDTPCAFKDDLDLQGTALVAVVGDGVAVEDAAGEAQDLLGGVAERENSGRYGSGER